MLIVHVLSFETAVKPSEEEAHRRKEYPSDKRKFETHGIAPSGIGRSGRAAPSRNG